MFSAPWIMGFLERLTLRRKAVSTTDKPLPPIEEVQEADEKIQKAVVDGGYEEDEVCSVDETGVQYGCQPKNPVCAGGHLAWGCA